MISNQVQQLIQMLGRLPGLGPRSARRAVLYLLKNRDYLLRPLIELMTTTADNIQICRVCGNYDIANPCHLCTDSSRDKHSICVVQEVADLWALERTGAFRGTYHVLGGALSALEGISPEDLHIPKLLKRVQEGQITEVILALNATVDGQTTAHYLTEKLSTLPTEVTALAHGVPLGGELDYLDDGTLSTALAARRAL